METPSLTLYNSADIESSSLAVTSSGTVRVIADGGSIPPGGISGSFLFGVNATGSGLDFGVYLGGSDGAGGSTINAIALDAVGDIYVAGSVGPEGVKMLTTANAYQSQYSNTGLSIGSRNGISHRNQPHGVHRFYMEPTSAQFMMTPRSPVLSSARTGRSTSVVPPTL